MTPYEEKLAALGITNRGQLATGFEAIGLGQFKESPLIDQNARKANFVRPAAEDLTRLNPHNTTVLQRASRKAWASMSPQERSRLAKLIAATRIGPRKG